MLYCKGATPPVPLAVILPFALAQEAVTAVAVTLGPVELGTVVVAVLRQLLLSLTVTV